MKKPIIEGFLNVNDLLEARKTYARDIISYLLKEFPEKYKPHSNVKRIFSKNGTTIETLSNDIQNIILNTDEYDGDGDISIVQPLEVSKKSNEVYSKGFPTVEFNINGTDDYITLSQYEEKGPTTEQHESCSIYAFKKSLVDGDSLISNYIDELVEIYPGIESDPSWQTAFQSQVNAVTSYLQDVANIKSYSFFRDNDFTTKLYAHVKKIVKFSSKDSWDPADVWIVDNPNKRLKDILSLSTIEEINRYLSKGIINKTILPLSLKKTGRNASIDEINIEQHAAEENIQIMRAECDLNYDEKNHKFTHNGGRLTSSNNILFVFRISSGLSYTIEAAQKGAKAQLGKVPAHIYRKYLNSDFYAKDWLKEFKSGGANEKDIKTYYNFLFNNPFIETRGGNWEDFLKGMKFLYNGNKSHKKLYAEKAITMECFYNLFKKSKNDQNKIITIFAYSAQKKGSEFGPFVKIY